MTSQFQEQPAVLLAINEEDKPYLPLLESALSGTRTKVFAGEIVTVTQLVQLAKKAQLNCIVTTRVDLLKLLLPHGREHGAKVSNYAGSVFPWGDFEVLIIDPLKQLRTVTYGQFMAKRYISKLTKRGKWRVPTKFDWAIVDDERKFVEAKQWLSSCDLIGLDIETAPPIAVTCSGYCGIKLATNTSKTFVVDMKAFGAIRWFRELNELSIPKCLQNGKYDAAYCFAYSAPISHYYYDTANAFHSWYSELPKDLASLSAFFVRESMYWKDLADSADHETRLKYNALDCWSTVEAWIGWMLEAPAWAKRNYVAEFTQVPICHMMEMTGIRRDLAELQRVNDEYSEKAEQILQRLKDSIAPEFNPSSPVQVLKLIHALGYKKAEDSEEKTLLEASYAHPLNERLIGDILEYRGLRKLVSTYLPNGVKIKGKKNPTEIVLNKEFRGFILFALNPHGTDTSRMASKAHHFWCGLQIQNIPRDGEESGAVKRTLVAEDGWEFYEADFSQAEARGVAYKSGDLNLIRVVEDTKDFHSVNASAFFGIPYEEIYRDAVAEYIDNDTGLVVSAKPAKTLNKELRDLSKRTNHGANYNMGARVMLDTMGSKKVREAQRLLQLPKHWALLDVCEFLLKRYALTYPKVKTTYYEKIKADVRNTSMLVGDTGLTRYCFGNPSKNKPDLNSYVAHVTQSLNAQNLNEAVRRVFVELWQNPNIKIIAQIHDSILFMVRIGHEYLAERVRELMTFPVAVTDCTGIKRSMLVPVDLKKLGRTWAGHD